jgi:hypothetical protein
LLEIVVKTSVAGQEVLNVYSPNVVFEIGQKTTKITSDTEKSTSPQVVTTLVKSDDDSSQIKAGVITITMVVAVILLVLIILNTENNNTIKNEYKLELNKILKESDEKIVEVNNKIEIEEHNLVDVKEFNEIIKVSEELSKPVLYWNDENNEESWFCVIGNNIGYRYILKR